MSEEEAALFRADHIGFVFQFFALVSVCTIRENLALVLDSHSSAGDQAWQQEVISRMGIEPWLDKYPHELSGGQQQRAAIAVAMIRKPDVILADEPTGNLDRQSGMDVMRLLKMSEPAGDDRGDGNSRPGSGQTGGPDHRTDRRQAEAI